MIKEHEKKDLKMKEIPLEVLVGTDPRTNKVEQISTDTMKEKIASDIQRSGNITKETWEKINYISSIAPYLKLLAIEGAEQSSHQALQLNSVCPHFEGKEVWKRYEYKYFLKDYSLH